MTYAILYLGEHNLTGAVRDFESMRSYEAMCADVCKPYEMADFPECIRAIDRHFGGAAFSLRSLFKDEQRRILNEILESTREDLEGRFKLVAERYGPLMKFLLSAGAPLPPGLDTITDFVLHGDIRREVQSDPIDFDRLRALIHEARSRGTEVLNAHLSYVIKNRMEQMVTRLAQQPEHLEEMQGLERLAELVMPLPLGLNLWKVQNTYWGMLQGPFRAFRDRALAGDPAARGWVGRFLALGERLGFAVEHLHIAASPAKIAA